MYQMNTLPFIQGTHSLPILSSQQLNEVGQAEKLWLLLDHPMSFSDKQGFETTLLHVVYLEQQGRVGGVCL